jgi:S-adenosylhomocysteine hydrolase
LKRWDLTRLDGTRFGEVRSERIRRKRGVKVETTPDLPPTAGFVATEANEGAGVAKLKAHEVVGKNRGHVGLELDPRERLEHLFGLAKVEPTKVPTRTQLTARIKSKLGSMRRMFSPIETARVLGSASLAPAVAGLGAEHSHAAWRGEESFLVAAHLARWMEGSFAGATLDDVAASFLQHHPSLREKYKRFDARLVELLQKAYPFMPAWSTKPDEPKIDARDWSSVPGPGQLYGTQLDEALAELSKIPLSMKLVDRVAGRLAEKRSFAGHNVVMVQHMLGQAHPFVGAMVRAGLDTSKAEFVGVPYQRNPAVKLALERTYGIPVTIGERGDMDGMWKTVTEAIDRAVARAEKNHEPILVIDDGGYASKYIATKYGDRKDLVFKVVEQTTRGLTEISSIRPTFPIVNVAGSIGKRLESAKVGESVVYSIKRILGEMASTVSHKDVLVVGGGKVGLGVAEAFTADGSRVSIYDPFLTHERRRFLEKKGFRVITDKAEALAGKFLVVGASGHRSIDIRDFAAMSSPVFVASCSSKRIEIDSLGLTLEATSEGKLRKILAARVNEQETWHYWLKDGKLVTALADTLPVNFQDVNSIPPELIDHTMALMLVGAARATEATEHGLVDLERGVQFDLQAHLEGLRSKPQPNDLGISVFGEPYYGDRAVWHSIAESPATPPEVLLQLYEQLCPQNPMGDTVLACLHPEHELSDALVSRVLAAGFLPHISRLLQNQYLQGEQRQAIVDYLMRGAFGVWELMARLDGTKHDYPVSLEGHRPIAVERDERGGFCYTQIQFDGATTQIDLLPGGKSSSKEAADLLISQISALAFSLPDDVFPRKQNPFRWQLLADPNLLFESSASHVHILRSPTWTTAELHKLVDGAFGTKQRPAHVFERFQDATKRFGTERALKYGCDVFEALREHPNADAYVRDRTTMLQHGIVEFVNERWPLRGQDFWPDSVLGVPAPEYL